MTSPFNPDELERYARHLVLPEVGGPGQQKLKAARVLVVGAGGLGAPSLQYLAAAGVGQITIIDDDTVSLSNLQRQVIHDTGSIREPKVESAKQSIQRINPHVEVTIHNTRITSHNAANLIKGHTLALDGSDNFATRYLMADACAEAKVPLITAAVNRFDGSITTLKPWEDENPSYRDLFPNQPEEGLLPSCSETGVLGAVTGILGTMQALEAIKEITGAGEGLVGRLVMVDGLSMRVETVRYKRRKI
ncbi:MAG: molybdopterin-synthase adenylyltransferase MoeB [Rhizobiaceae bacterium]